ncbi:MAG TPA: beta galactosidase jelly roll domain-containing protein [Bacteroidales bacterium]|nr:beta galactosidase jelly roll domain-containing protein [Bacteroidales bacterium]HPT21312.1 beta galactosidase jelly roll domain-containing protein [Bacteroidales bacterium]
MKIITAFLLTFLCISVSVAQNKIPGDQKSIPIKKIINSQWTFNYFPDEATGKGYEMTGYNDSKWPVVSIPHTWNTFETTGSLNPFILDNAEIDKHYWWMGWGWYRKHFSVNRNYYDCKVILRFDGVRKYCKVWLNGRYLGDHNDATSSFDFDITRAMNMEGDNVLAVAVNNREENELKQSTVQGKDDMGMYSGIIRNVSLVLKSNLYMLAENTGKYEGGVNISVPQVSKKEAVVRIQTWVKNDHSQKKNCILQTSIFDAADNLVQINRSEAVINPGLAYRFDQTGTPIKKPHLWSKENPYIYKITVEVIDGNEVVDALTSSSDLKFTLTDNVPATLYPADNKDDQNDPADLLVFNHNRGKNDKETGRSAGEPAKIVLASTQKKIPADRGSVATITADIVDSNGTHFNGANKTIKWVVTGPATLVGPEVFEPYASESLSAGYWYSSMPVTNIVRSSGKSGNIHIAVFASGLASGSIDIEAQEIKPDNSVIIEPILDDEGRKPVARITLSTYRLEEIPPEIRMTSDEISINSSDRSGFAHQIRDYICKNNTSVDSSSVEFMSIVDMFASYLQNNNGHLITDDYNYNVEHYNKCRLIAGYINATKLPPAFKDCLRKYYSDIIIMNGSEKNAGEEMNWLNWIPSGGTVVISRNGVTGSSTKGVIETNKSQLVDLIAVVHPSFVSFSDDAKERALIFIDKMNPYVHAAENIGGDSKTSYVVETDKPVLIPLLKFIAE